MLSRRVAAATSGRLTMSAPIVGRSGQHCQPALLSNLRVSWLSSGACAWLPCARFMEQRAHRATSGKPPPAAESGRRQQVYEALMRGILEGVYEPNQRLTETELAQELGVSRLTVRLALVRLAQDGL